MDYVSIPLSQLRLGAVLHAPIYEKRADRDILLLSNGVTLTEPVLAQLRDRGLSQVRVHRNELKRIIGRKPGSSAPFAQRIRRHGAVSYDSGAEIRIRETFQHSLQEVEAFFDELQAGKVVSIETLESVSTEMLLKTAEDIDLFVATGLQPGSSDYPHGHCLQTSMLAMAIGASMGLTQSKLIELGIGCLAHDTGMLQLDAKLYEVERKLTESEFREVKKHPLLALELVKDLKGLSSDTRQVIQQVHERMNGAGYPTQCVGSQIDPLARIAAVADVFVALVSPRPHRPAYLPYHGMKQMIEGRGQGLFDEASTRALLHTVSMFPIGSFIEVSDGRKGTVLRTCSDAYMRPVVALRETDQPGSRIAVIDLSATEEVRIVRPLKTLAAA